MRTFKSFDNAEYDTIIAIALPDLGHLRCVYNALPAIAKIAVISVAVPRR